MKTKIKKYRWAVSLMILLLSVGCLSAATPQPSAAPLAPATTAKMTWGQAVLLGLTEGLTEYLPVSSTGHLYLVSYLLGLGKTAAEKEAADAYIIAIQIGAILAVFWLYFGRVAGMLKGLAGRDPQGLKLLFNTFAAFFPAAVIGLLAEKTIKSYLFGLPPIVLAWLAGGAVILWVSRRGKTERLNGAELVQLTLRQAVIIGLFQCIAMWPGVSRSLVTILGGITVGLTLPAAVEFSFILGLLTLGAATGYELVKEGPQILMQFGWQGPLWGLMVAFLSAAAAVKWMVSYLNNHSLAVFGYYRIVLALAALPIIFYS